jgi:hypothetical protein
VVAVKPARTPKCRRSPLSRFTRSGITSVVALLGTDDATRHPRELVTAVNALQARRPLAWCYTAGYHVPPVTITGSVRGDIADHRRDHRRQVCPQRPSFLAAHPSTNCCASRARRTWAGS